MLRLSGDEFQQKCGGFFQAGSCFQKLRQRDTRTVIARLQAKSGTQSIFCLVDAPKAAEGIAQTDECGCVIRRSIERAAKPTLGLGRATKTEQSMSRFDQAVGVRGIIAGGFVECVKCLLDMTALAQ